MPNSDLTKEIALLRQDLLDSGYSKPGVLRLLGRQSLVEAKHGAPWSARRKLADALSDTKSEDHLLSVLVSLFVVGDSLPSSVVERVFSALTIAGAKQLGIIAPGVPGTVTAAFSITPHTTILGETNSTMWIISDLDDHLRTNYARHDHVMGIGGATLSLISAIPNEPIVYSADVGTGNGLVALELAQISKQVLATDISKRALLFAKLNAQLNNVENISWGEGDLFDPIQGQKFDLIVSNPPFVITPQGELSHWEYRSNFETGDALLNRMLKDVGKYLYHDGTFIALGNWEENISPGDKNLSYWIIERGSQTPLEYVETWLRDSGVLQGSIEYSDFKKQWIKDFNIRDVTEITYGYILIRNVAIAEPIKRTELISGPLGMHTENTSIDGSSEVEMFGQNWSSYFSAVHRIHAMSKLEILDTVFFRNKSVYELRTLVPGTENIIALNLIKQGGIERQVQVDTTIAAVVGACDGELNLGQIINALCVLLEVSYEQLEAEVLSKINELLWLGILSTALPD
ncbi:MAG TPA: methyltransferase [Microbacteriaceae bacterium]|nr:methyltransferase [Microbacteriaceae bacterium]